MKEEIKTQNYKNYKNYKIMSIVYNNMNTEDKVKKYDLYDKAKTIYINSFYTVSKIRCKFKNFSLRHLISSQPLQSPEA